jgi:hypothetical protein
MTNHATRLAEATALLARVSKIRRFSTASQHCEGTEICVVNGEELDRIDAFLAASTAPGEPGKYGTVPMPQQEALTAALQEQANRDFQQSLRKVNAEFQPADTGTVGGEDATTEAMIAAIEDLGRLADEHDALRADLRHVEGERDALRDRFFDVMVALDVREDGPDADTYVDGHANAKIHAQAVVSQCDALRADVARLTGERDALKQTADGDCQDRATAINLLGYANRQRDAAVARAEKAELAVRNHEKGLQAAHMRHELAKAKVDADELDIFLTATEERAEQAEAEAARLEDLLRGSSRTDFADAQAEITVLRNDILNAKMFQRQAEAERDRLKAEVENHKLLAVTAERREVVVKMPEAFTVQQGSRAWPPMVCLASVREAIIAAGGKIA